MEEDCVICCKSLSFGWDIVTLRQKGSDSINSASQKRGSDLQTVPGQCVHTACRLDFTNRNAIAQDLRKSQAPVDSESAAVLRSSTTTFSFEEHCLFCGKPKKYEGCKRGFELVPVLTTVLHESLSDA